MIERERGDVEPGVGGDLAADELEQLLVQSAAREAAEADVLDQARAEPLDDEAYRGEEG